MHTQECHVPTLSSGRGCCLKRNFETSCEPNIPSLNYLHIEYLLNTFHSQVSFLFLVINYAVFLTAKLQIVTLARLDRNNPSYVKKRNKIHSCNGYINLIRHQQHIHEWFSLE